MQQLSILLLQGVSALSRRPVLRRSIRDALLQAPVHLLRCALEAFELVGRGDELRVQVVVPRRQPSRLAGQHLDLRARLKADTFATFPCQHDVGACTAGGRTLSA